MLKAEDTPTSDIHQLDTLFAVARRHDSALVLALAVRDPVATHMAAGCLDQTLRRASAALVALSGDAPSRRAELITMFVESTRGMYERLKLAVSSAPVLDSRRMIQWLKAPGRSALTPGGPDLFALDAQGVALPAVTFLGLHVAKCWFITDLHDSTLIDAFVEQSDFSYGQLRNTLWQETRVHRSYFRDASFLDATFDRAVFVECDLRGADFSVANTNRLATTSRLDLVRCDLRGTLWTGRDLSHVRTVDCDLDELVDTADVSQLAGGCRHAALPDRCRLAADANASRTRELE
jgi:hypothetical protein